MGQITNEKAEQLIKDVEHKDLESPLMIMAIQKILELEDDTGVSRKVYKNALRWLFNNFTLSLSEDAAGGIVKDEWLKCADEIEEISEDIRRKAWEVPKGKHEKYMTALRYAAGALRSGQGIWKDFDKTVIDEFPESGV